MNKNKKTLTMEEIIDLALKRSLAVGKLERDLESEGLSSSFSDDQTLDPAVETGLNAALDRLGISRAELNKQFDEPVKANYAKNADEIDRQQSAIGSPEALDTVLDWMSATLENLGGTFGSPTVARANSGHANNSPKAPRATNAADRIWKQGEMMLTLLSSGKQDFTVVLQIEGDAPGKPLRLLWVDEASLRGHPSEPPKLVEFPIEQQDDGSYRVMIPARIYGVRMRAIIAAEKQNEDKNIDARLLLPFVEMD